MVSDDAIGGSLASHSFALMNLLVKFGCWACIGVDDAATPALPSGVNALSAWTRCFSKYYVKLTRLSQILRTSCLNEYLTSFIILFVDESQWEIRLMRTTDDVTRTTHGITDDDRERIRAFLAAPAYRRTPDLLCPDSE